MFKNITQRLTYRNLLQLMGFLIALVIGVMWIRGDKIPIEGLEDQYEPFLYIIGVAGGLLLLVLTIIFPRLVSDEPIFGVKDKPISENTRHKNRDDMLTLVEQIWITGFLDNVLNQKEALNLKLDFLEPDKVATRHGWEDFTLTTTRAIHKHFNDLSRRMVILGVPGAGKTVLLLQLCQELITEARADERRPIPAVFALSSWAASATETLPFEDWLKQELRGKYGLTQKIAADLVESEQLLYLLDGLDEVADERRDACLQAIKHFVEVERPGLPYVICSRKQEFEELATRLDIAGEIVIQALRPEQIAEYLRGAEFTGLRTLIRENTIIREQFVPVPFMLNTLAVVAVVKRDKDADHLRREISAFAEDEARLRDYFLETYLNRRLHDYFLQVNPAKPKLYAYNEKHYKDRKQTRRWLKWLAGQLVWLNQTDFYIENLQPYWLDSIAEVKSYQRRFGLICGLALGLITGLVCMLEFGVAVGVAVGLAVGVAVGLAVGVAAGRKALRVVDQVIWRFSWEALVITLITFIFIPTQDIFINKSPYYEISVRLIAGLLLGLIMGVSGGFSSQEIISFRLRHNARIRSSFSTFSKVFLQAVVLLGGFYALLGNLTLGLALGLAFGLVGGLRNGGFTVIQHVILRSILAHNGHIPRWRYDHFLDYAAELVILRKVGGGYRFVHDYMRQYLASSAFEPDAYFVERDV